MLPNQNNWDHAVIWLFSCPEVDYVLTTLRYLQREQYKNMGSNKTYVSFIYENESCTLPKWFCSFSIEMTKIPLRMLTHAT